MIRSLIISLVLSLACSSGFGQNSWIDSLKFQLENTTRDSSRVFIMAELCNAYSELNFDSAKLYWQLATALADRIGFLRGQVKSLNTMGISLLRHGDIPQALELEFKALQWSEERHFLQEKIECLFAIGKIYLFLTDYPRARSYYRNAKKLIKELPKSSGNKNYYFEFEIDQDYAEAFLFDNKLDSARIYLQNVYDQVPFARGNSGAFLGDIYFRMGNHQKGFAYLHQSIKIIRKLNDHYSGGWAYGIIARFFKEINQRDSSIYYAKIGLDESSIAGFKLRMLECAKLLANQYAYTDIKAAHTYLQLVVSLNDELYGS